MDARVMLAVCFSIFLFYFSLNTQKTQKVEMEIGHGKKSFTLSFKLRPLPTSLLYFALSDHHQSSF